MLICPSDIFSSTNIILLGQVLVVKEINLVVEEISRNQSAVQTPITYFINQKEKHLSIRHNSK